MAKLKLCPFCGGVPKLEIDTEYEQSWVVCPNCGAETKLFYDTKGKNAVEEWNRRADNLSEKQIPQKPKMRPYLSIHPSFHLAYTSHCPDCGVAVEKYKTKNIFSSRKNNYCYNCGQALDWGRGE